MTVFNPNDEFSKKGKPDHTGYRLTSYGSKHVSNVKWIYDFAPLKKWGTIVLAALALAGTTWSIRQEVLQKKEIQKAQAEASQERNQYLLRRLETVKKQTIEAELKKANREQLALAEKTPRNRQVSKGLPIYTWTNERGQTVYSNKPREK